MSYQTAVSHWAAKQRLGSRYGWDTRTMNHLTGTGKTDACRLDPDTIGTVEFEAMEGGGCETCSYTYMAATFTGSCVCGKVKNKAFEVDLDSKDLAVILEEVMACEPYSISEMIP